MSMILLCRDTEHMKTALRDAAGLMAYLYQKNAIIRDSDELLGVLIRRDLDSDLATWPVFHKLRMQISPV